ncbi:MAG: plasmid stabilization protein [Hyphomicrobiaceae bacterium]
MTTVTISNIDNTLAQRLAARAAAHGRSVEAEAKDILSNALGGAAPDRVPDNLYDAIRAIVEPIGGIELELMPRQPVRDPPKFE